MTHPNNVFVKHGFLPKRELQALTKYVLQHESDFTPSTVVSHEGPDSASDPSYRKSLVLYNLGEYTSMIQDRLLNLLPRVLTTFERESFPISHFDIQLTASNDGDFFKVHQDNSSEDPVDIHRREVSFVYYFHTEPKAFTGGQLKLYNSQDGEVQQSKKKTAQTITPQQNTLVLFPSSYDHEVLPVRCPSRKFVSSRFTVNGWIIREEKAAAPEPRRQEDMSWLIDAARELNVAYPRPWTKLYLTLEEASQFSGLSTKYLQKLVKEERLTAIDDGGLKIRRADLERL
jgi:Rps23 Pro-64 3,4-dihydroxylase Tpa1-like proline 4-hydroxylase